MKKRIHHKKWNKKLRRSELQFVWQGMNANAPDLSVKLLDKFNQAMKAVY